MDFAGLIQDENLKDSYIQASVDSHLRYPHAKLCQNCDTEPSIQFLKRNIKFRCLPRNIRCDQAQAFKSRQFEIICNDKKIKLKLAPVGAQRTTS